MTKSYASVKIITISENDDAEGRCRKAIKRALTEAESESIAGLKLPLLSAAEIRCAVCRVKAYERRSLTAIRVEPWSILYASSQFRDGAFLFCKI